MYDSPAMSASVASHLTSKPQLLVGQDDTGINIRTTAWAILGSLLSCFYSGFNR